MIIESTLKAKLIYIFGIDDKTHEGCLKIGEATLDEDAGLFALSPNCEALNNAAHKRISQYTQTAGIQYHLFHTELAMVTTTQHLSKSNFQFVPLQDFSEPWTDEKLYAKYGITPDEQAYIESLIKPME